MEHYYSLRIGDSPQFTAESFNYEVVRSKKRRKTISLHVRANGTPVIYVPHRTPIPEIDKFIREKESWLWRKIRENGERQKAIKAKKYASGEIFFFLGDPYPLKIGAAALGCDKLAFLCGQFVLASDKISQGRVLFVEWYQEESTGIHWGKNRSLQPGHEARLKRHQDKQCSLPLGFMFSG